jgi:hypothetical protein
MTLAELLLSVGIMSFLIMVIYALMGNARVVYFDVSITTQIRNDLRQAARRMEIEMRNTGYDSCGLAQFTVSAGAGVNATDTVRFSIPVTCSTTATLLDCSGTAADCAAADRCTSPKHFISPGHWGAPLTWGCNSSSCMDADNSCATVEYKYVQYALNNNSQLVRTVLSPALNVVGSDVIASNITGMTLTVNNASHVITLALTAGKRSVVRKTAAGIGVMLTESISQNIRLMN